MTGCKIQNLWGIHSAAKYLLRYVRHILYVCALKAAASTSSAAEHMSYSFEFKFSHIHYTSENTKIVFSLVYNY